MVHLGKEILFTTMQNYQTMKRQGGVLNAHYQVKEADVNRIHSI